MKTKIDYSFVIGELVMLREVIVVDLKSNESQEMISKKAEIERAIKWLERA